MATEYANENVRYEPDEKPPHPVAIGSGFQAAMVIAAPVVLTVVIVARIAGGRPRATYPGPSLRRC